MHAAGPPAALRRGPRHALSALVVVMAFLFAGCTGPSEGGVIGGGGPAGSDRGDDDGLPYELLSYRTPRDEAAHYAVPPWNVGDVWEYEIEPAGWRDECTATDPQTPRSHDEVVGQGERDDLDGLAIYRVRITAYGCQGETQSVQDYDYRQDMLAPLDERGHWLPKIVFPLEDGKRWRFTTPDGTRVESEVTWLPEHTRDGRTVTAWRIEHHHQRADDAVETQWFGEDTRNLLHQEIHRDTDDDGETELRVSKTLIAHDPADE